MGESRRYSPGQPWNGQRSRVFTWIPPTGCSYFAHARVGRMAILPATMRPPCWSRSDLVEGLGALVGIAPPEQGVDERFANELAVALGAPTAGEH